MSIVSFLRLGGENYDRKTQDIFCLALDLNARLVTTMPRHKVFMFYAERNINCLYYMHPIVLGDIIIQPSTLHTRNI
jgi:hypothetical protein